MDLAGHKFDERRLIRQVMRNLSCRRGERNVLRWVLVMQAFAVGSTVAHALCHEFEMDPDEVIK